jgi:hypothetical protein
LLLSFDLIYFILFFVDFGLAKELEVETPELIKRNSHVNHNHKHISSSAKDNKNELQTTLNHTKGNKNKFRLSSEHTARIGTVTYCSPGKKGMDYK